MTKHWWKLSKIYRKLIKGADRIKYRSYRAGKKWKLADNQVELSKYSEYPFDGKKFYRVEGRKIMSSADWGKSWSVVSEIPAELGTANLALYRITAERTAWCVYGASDADKSVEHQIYLSFDDLKTFLSVVTDEDEWVSVAFSKLAVTPQGHILIGLHLDDDGEYDEVVIISDDGGFTWTVSFEDLGQLRSYEHVATLGRHLFKLGINSENDYDANHVAFTEGLTDIYILNRDSYTWEETDDGWNRWMQLYSDFKNKRMIGVGKGGLFETFDGRKWKPFTDQFHANEFAMEEKFNLPPGALKVQNILIADSGLMVIKCEENGLESKPITYWVSTPDSVRVAKHSAIVEEGLVHAGVPDDVIRDCIYPFLFPQI